MDKWKDELKKAFDAPNPMKKRAFLRSIDYPKMSIYSFLYSQIGYIHKWVWGISALFFFVSVLGSVFVPDNAVWLISGLTPLLALTIISESGRSERYKMFELEMATRFSLRSVTFARLTIISIMNYLLLLVILLITLFINISIPLTSSLYIVTPFLLSAYTGLIIVRKFRGQEGLFICVGVSVGISIFLFISHNIIPQIYQEQYFSLWLIAALLLLLGNIRQYNAIIKQTEELIWNLL
ncbi:MAG: hypothetical protein IKM20_09285 [Erysipelotrichales bacterium]|nr:hypothetical protein [Erysipelotrichales bacterium]